MMWHAHSGNVGAGTGTRVSNDDHIDRYTSQPRNGTMALWEFEFVLALTDNHN
jgi:hypothetical protein